MTNPTRIALIHALAHSVAPINASFERMWPECRRMNVLDDSLASDLARNPGGLDAAMTRRFLALGEYAVRAGAHGVLFTCSAFGPCIDAVRRTWPQVPVLKPNDGMIDEAVTVARARGGRIALLATFAPTLVSMPPEFPADVMVTPVHVPGAMDALDAQDFDRHDRLIAAAAGNVRGADAIALAQFSMARAVPAVGAVTDLPVFATPDSAVRALRRRLRAGAA